MKIIPESNTVKFKQPKTRYYAAYGSNLHLAQMAMRCPTAEVAGNSVMHGWGLRFRGDRHGAVATIERCKGETVPVLIWKIMPSDEASLDRYEGWPYLYRKETVRLSLNGKRISAMVYIMNEEKNPYGIPRGAYLDTIHKGYLDADFDREVLVHAITTSEKLIGKGDMSHETDRKRADLKSKGYRENQHA